MKTLRNYEGWGFITLCDECRAKLTKWKNIEKLNVAIEAGYIATNELARLMNYIHDPQIKEIYLKFHQAIDLAIIYRNSLLEHGLSCSCDSCATKP